LAPLNSSHRMSDPAPELKKPNRPARQLNRWGIGSISAIQLALVAATVIAINFLAARHFTRADFSRDGNYSLSQATTSYLAGDDLATRETPVKWILAFRRVSPFYERVRVLTEEYARLSGGRIELEVLDPIRSPERTKEVMAGYGLSFVRDVIIMDARADDSPALTSDAAGTRSLNANVKLVTAEEMVVYTIDEQGQRRPRGFQGEDVLTARLVEALEGRPRKMLFLADKSRIGAEGEDSPWRSLERTLRFQNIELTPVEMAGMRDIPEDAEGVALVAPRYDFTDAEIELLERYFNQPKAAMLLLLEPGQTPPKLRAFLRGYGITPRRDVLVTRDGDRLVSTVRGAFTLGNPFTSELAGQSAIFEGVTSSLEVRENAEDLLNRRIFPVSLIEAGADFWGETKFGEGAERYDEREDHTAPLTIAAGVTRGAAGDDRFAESTSRMVVVSNVDFLQPENQRAENLDFLASSVNWLVGRESLAGIGPRSLGTYKLPLLDAQVSFINRVNLIFLPAFLALIGGFIWSSRRA
jgi:hypothetical protein